MDPHIAREMVVANARLAQRRLFRSRPKPRCSGLFGEAQQRFERFTDVGASEHIISVTTRLAAFDQAAIAKLPDVKAGGLQGDARFLGQFAIGERPARQQGRQHRAPRGIGDQRGYDREIRPKLHRAILAALPAKPNAQATVRPVSKRSWHPARMEKAFWLEGVEAYRRDLADDAVMVFPAPTGPLTGEVIYDALKDAPRWQELTISDPRLTRHADGVVTLVYMASAVRDDDRYEAFCGSCYLLAEGEWKLVLHQQTPIKEA